MPSDDEHLKNADEALWDAAIVVVPDREPPETALDNFVQKLNTAYFENSKLVQYI